MMIAISEIELIHVFVNIVSQFNTNKRSSTQIV